MSDTTEDDTTESVSFWSLTKTFSNIASSLGFFLFRDEYWPTNI